MITDTLCWLVHWISTKIQFRHGCHVRHRFLLLKHFVYHQQFWTIQILLIDTLPGLWTMKHLSACTPDDIIDLAEVTMAMMALLRCRLWVEWIDSNSNPADGLSRKGLADPLFGTTASVASCPAWQSTADFSLRCFAVLQAGFPARHY